MNKSILIIDDDTRNIFALSALLKARKYTTLSANSVEEGMAMLDDGAPVGIILLDMMMPGTDGYQALPLLKGNERYAQIPVVAVTAQAMTGDREKCLAAGADDYLSKPIDVDRLVELLNRYIR